MSKEKTYFSIRIVKAKNTKDAIEEVICQNFDDDHELADKVLTTEDLIKALLLVMENEKNV